MKQALTAAALLAASLTGSAALADITGHMAHRGERRGVA